MNDEYLIYGETLTNIANSIRSVSNDSTTWTPDEMAAYILANLVKPTTRQAAKTYTPSTSNQTIPKGTFLTGAATIQGDADLTAANIKKGVNIFGKTGTLSGAWGDASKFNGITKVSSGSFTLTSSTATEYYSISHGLGMSPKVFILLLGEGSSYDIGSFNPTKRGINIAAYAQLSNSTYTQLTVTFGDTNGNNYLYYPVNKGLTTPSHMGSSNKRITVDSTTIKVSPDTTTNSYFYYSVPYYWIALA